MLAHCLVYAWLWSFNCPLVSFLPYRRFAVILFIPIMNVLEHPYGGDRCTEHTKVERWSKCNRLDCNSRLWQSTNFHSLLYFVLFLFLTHFDFCFSSVSMRFFFFSSSFCVSFVCVCVYTVSILCIYCICRRFSFNRMNRNNFFLAQYDKIHKKGNSQHTYHIQSSEIHQIYEYSFTIEQGQSLTTRISK